MGFQEPVERLVVLLDERWNRYVVVRGLHFNSSVVLKLYFLSFGNASLRWINAD